PPKSNQAYWGPKLARNVERDAASKAMLRKQGWRTLVIWECETKNAQLLADKIAGFLRPELHTPESPPSSCPSPARGEGTRLQRAHPAPSPLRGRGLG
ncbi:MAG: hypothetical protein ACLP1W_03980, partial [Rhodomicrobium sp.]